MEALNAFLCGILVALSLVVSLLFLRYWRVARDRFFVFIAVAFVALAMNWGALAGFARTEHTVYVFLLRLIAFLILIAGIVDKNRRGARTD
jgi:hypothetical protein